MRSTAQELSESLQRIGASMYQQQQSGPTQPPPGGEAEPGQKPSEEGTVEGEFREV